MRGRCTYLAYNRMYSWSRNYLSNRDGPRPKFRHGYSFVPGKFAQTPVEDGIFWKINDLTQLEIHDVSPPTSPVVLRPPSCFSDPLSRLWLHGRTGHSPTLVQIRLEKHVLTNVTSNGAWWSISRKPARGVMPITGNYATCMSETISKVVYGLSWLLLLSVNWSPDFRTNCWTWDVSDEACSFSLTSCEFIAQILAKFSISFWVYNVPTVYLVYMRKKPCNVYSFARDFLLPL